MLYSDMNTTYKEFMKLRNFLYINSDMVEEYVSSIDGYTYDEEQREIAVINEKSRNSVDSSLDGGIENYGRKEEEIRRTARVSSASKFDKIYKYLSTNGEDSLKYFESIDEDSYKELRRDDYLEVLVTARFSKMKEVADAVKKFAELASTIENITEQRIIDKKTKSTIKGFVNLEKINSEKEVTCVFEFEDKQYPIVARLDNSFFQCEQERFVGEAYLMCKIIRKIDKGKSIRLDEIFEDIKKFPLNRDQRRKMPKNMANPAELSDVIKGPALVVLPIAVYQ